MQGANLDYSHLILEQGTHSVKTMMNAIFLTHGAFAMASICENSRKLKKHKTMPRTQIDVHTHHTLIKDRLPTCQVSKLKLSLWPHINDQRLA